MAGKTLIYEPVTTGEEVTLWKMNETDVGAACASYKTCDECLAASRFCHFCEADFMCHALTRGCVVGIDKCHHMDECIRHDPQFVGYGPPPSVVIAVLCLVVTLTCCLCGLSAMCTVFVRASKRKAKRKVKRPQNESSEDVEAAGLLDTIGEEDELVYYEDEDSLDEAAAERVRRLQERSERAMPWKSFCTRLLWIGALAAMTVVGLMFYPRLPDYNVCNRQFEWESIIHSLMTATVTIEYQVLMSIINENRFGFILESGYADIYHNKTHIGVWELNNTLEAAAGSITDVLAPVRIKPGITEAFSLWNDLRQNKLVFHINASISGSITWGKYKLFRVDSVGSEVEFLVNADYPRVLCNCSQFVTNPPIVL